MHGPDGQDFLNEALFSAIDPAAKIVVQHTNLPHFVLTIGFEAVVSGTRVTWEQVFDDAAIAASVKHVIEPSNEQNLDRWQAEVGTGPTHAGQANR
jgi:hypothetical protein